MSTEKNQFEFDSEILNHVNFSIGTKKRLENVIEENKKAKFEYEECQILYDRLV